MTKKLTNLLTVILLAVFLTSTFLLLRNLFSGQEGDESYEEALAIAQVPEETAAAETSEPAAETTVPETAPPQIRWVPAAVDEADPNLEQLRTIDLDALREVNPDVLGWILIPDTKINYPILQAEDNEYYLYHTWQNNRNYVGSIFLESQNSPDFSDYNTVIYGHNLRNGSMFAALRRYSGQEFYEEHPHVYIVTDQGIFLYEIFASYRAGVESLTYAMVMQQDDTRQEFLDYTLAESVIETPVVPSLTDQIITLSTCTGHGYTSRWVVHARLEMLPVME